MPQLTLSEQNKIDKMVRSEKGAPIDAWRALKAARGKVRIGGRKLKGPSMQAVYNCVHGVTHRTGATEARGREKILTKADIRKAMQAGVRLIQQARGERRVVYSDIIAEAMLGKEVSQATVERACRATSRVRYMPVRAKVYLTARDAKVRRACAHNMVKRNTSYWPNHVHAFMDNKAWPIPLTAIQRARYSAQKVTGHLRLPSEGTDYGFTKPRTAHSFLGLPSISICAAVAKDRVILRHDCGAKWNGQVASDMYRGALLNALRRVWGQRATYQIVEDGGRKGYQTNKAKEAKEEVGISSIVLPPRSPSLMPLDAAIWPRVDRLMEETAPDGVEERADFIAGLQDCAKKLPRGFVARSIERTRENLGALVRANGYHPKND